MMSRKPTSPIRVLLVEDHADTREAMTRLLRGSFDTVRSAGTCQTARDVAADPGGPPDVVVGDIGLPDGDGVALLSELKGRYGCAAIALSGFDETDRCNAAGVDRHLLKPVPLQTLRAIIEEVGGHRGN